MITLLVLAVCLLVLGLLFGKRFGVLVLALAAGLVLTQYMGATVMAMGAPYLKQYTTYVPAALVVLPSLPLLLFAKGRHRKIVARVVSAAVYAFAGLVFVIAAPGTPASLAGDFPFITNNLGYVVAGLVIIATLEVSFGKLAKKKSVEEPHHK